MGHEDALDSPAARPSILAGFRISSFVVFVNIGIFAAVMILSSNSSSILKSFRKSADVIDSSDSSDPSSSTFSLTTPSFSNDGWIPLKHTCASSDHGSSPPMSWNKGPPGTVEYMLSMWEKHSESCIRFSWLLYGIDASVTSIDAGVPDKCSDGYTCGGTYPGNPFYNYNPPCSLGGGENKTYFFTLYALSKPAQTAIATIHDIRNIKLAPYIIDAVNRAGFVLANSTVSASSSVVRTRFVGRRMSGEEEKEEEDVAHVHENVVVHENEEEEQERFLVDDSWMDCDDGHLQLVL